MPVYNAARYVRAAVDSILAQTYRDFEFLIVDDGSTDGSREILGSYTDPRMRIVPMARNVGLSNALNAGLSEVRTPYVARQDADDVSEPQRLERQVMAVGAQPQLAVLGTRGRAITERGTPYRNVWRPLTLESIRWYALFDNPFIHTSVVFKTAVVRDEAGGFNSSLDPFSQDWSVWCRVMERHPVANLADPLVRYRVLPSSIIGALGNAQDAAYHERFARIVREIVADNATRTLRAGAMTTDETLLMSRFVLGLEHGDIGRFLELFERVLRLFHSQYPGAEAAADFRRTLAQQFDALAVRVTPGSRRAALRIYAHALSHHPGIATELPWTRAMALMTLGHEGRRRLSDWRRSPAII